jgi:flagellar basal body P-ring formation protein FlgA
MMKLAPSLGSESLTGATEVKIARKSRQLDVNEMGKLLIEKLQANSDPSRTDELELRLMQWRPITVPVEPVEVRILSQPAGGISARFSVRFEVKSGEDNVGIFTAFVEAHLFREVWVARTLIKRGTTLDNADLVRERRDVLANLRDPPWSGQDLAPHFQATYDIAGGAIVPARAIKARAVIQRGHLAQAVAMDGLLTVSTKVEVLEDGAPGQLIRVRNPRTKKELRGKVIDEDKIELIF